MGGFKNEIINSAFDAGIINVIMAHLTKCSKQMKADCIAADNFLKNNEDAITNRLVAVYLNTQPGIFRYEPQSPEHYDSETGCYIGRTDIKVISRDYFRDEQAYHIVECKRIDGTIALNQKYITEGVERFFSPTPQPKYSSYYLQNIMFGYVVQTIDISENADKIDKLQGSLLKGATASAFTLKQRENSQYYIYACRYVAANTGRTELHHLFFDFANIICKK
ncbi:MAG: hypothetical protein LBP73_09270 [Clostridiales Family XIII bacterium]|jgi:hypothetical protein|nr:hypothetical protein [Clostridiales Family XIII bacterium]